MASIKASLINITTPNLIAGVSQQPDGLRFPSQPLEQVNMWSSAVEGLIKRPNTRYVKKLISGDAGTIYTHTINRSDTEHYAVLIGDGWVRVFDADTGTEKTVATPNGVAYLNVDNSPKTSFRCKTILDYTFVVNREVTAAMSATTTAAKVNYALVFVKQGVASSTVYTVRVNGVDYSYTSATTDTDTIATGLASAISTGLGTGWTIDRFNYVIRIKKNDNSTFTCEAINKSTTGSILACFVGEAKNITELPTIGFNNDIVNITGVADDEGDEYWVKFETTSGGTSGAGLWRETIAPGIPYALDASSMPHVLVREGDGTFTFKRATWADRTCGDVETNPNPAFIGRKIKNTSFNRNRLDLLSGEGGTMSEAGSYFNYFRTTITSLLDSDPIETEATSENNSEQYSAVAFSSRFVSWGRNGQFLISGEPLLTPSTVTTSQVGWYSNDQAVDPIAIEDKVLYSFKRGEASDGSNNTGIAEFYLDDLTLEKFKSYDITSHIPTYIEGSAIGFAANDNNQVAFLQTTKSGNVLYVYKYYVESGNKRLQTAWFKAQFCTDCSVAGFGFINHLLLIFKQYEDGLYLENIDTSPALKDAYSNTVFLLDRRITENECVSVTYNDVNNTTEFVLPYTVTESSRIVVLGRYTDDLRDGNVNALSTADNEFLTTNDNIYLATQAAVGGDRPLVISHTSNSVTVEGKWNDLPVFIGMNYDSYVELATPMLRQQTASGGSVALQNGKFMVRSGLLSIANTRTLTVETEHRSTGRIYNSVYNNRIVGSKSNRLAANQEGINTFRFWMQAKNTDVIVRLRNNTPYQHSVLAIDYEGTYNTRSKQT